MLSSPVLSQTAGWRRLRGGIVRQMSTNLITPGAASAFISGGVDGVSRTLSGRAASCGVDNSGAPPTFKKREEVPAEADVVIIGGGVTGTALLYELSAFTDLKKVCLLERRSDFSKVASGPNNNSQTIHCGDIETNYTPEKAASVQRLAHMLRNYATKLPAAEQQKSIRKMQKMALAVGDEECEFMVKRYHAFKPVFKKLELIDKAKIAEVEPNVASQLIGGKALRPESLVANYVADEHSAVDYFQLTRNMVKQALEEGRADPSRDVRAMLNTEMLQIEPSGTGWNVHTNRGVIKARFVVTASCGYSLLSAHRLGYNKHFSCMPVAGSFYFGPSVLKGKVYCVQNPLLPFAAVHGDPDLVAGMKTRFGPTALPLPLLERYEWRTLKDFLEVLRPSASLAQVYWDLFKVPTIRNYLFKNVLFEVPGLNKRLFLKDARKIVPGLQLNDIEYAHGFGGVRPQIVDKKLRKLVLGEGKISPEDDPIIFNVTPSPGGTTCLGNAEVDMRKIAKFTGCNINESKLKKVLFDGLYPVEN